MRLMNGLAVAALAGLAAAGDAAEVYLFKSSSSSQSDRSSSSAPSIPKELARQIFLQRVGSSSALGSLPDTMDEETAISYVNRFGKSQSSSPFFAKRAPEPRQLVVIVEGYEADKAQSLKDVLATSQDAFLVSNPPSSAANIFLMADFHAAGVPSTPACSVVKAVGTDVDGNCWKGSSAVVRYDIQKTDISQLQTALHSLSQSISTGFLEALLVLLPEASRSSPLPSWAARSSHPVDLRRRQNEVVLTDDPVVSVAPKSAASSSPDTLFRQDKGTAKKAPVPACFLSASTCENRTNGCSGGHGRCINRYADQAGHEPCFACHCMATVVVNATADGTGEKTVRWGGNMCQKEDISVQFWLLTGFTIAIVGAVTFAIGLLYSVGEEKLPGVIGAGVSRSSK